MKKPKRIIEVKNLLKSYGENHVLKGIDLSVDQGKMLALLGPNGSGKTTTVRILSTLLNFDGGEVLIGGHNVAKEPDRIRNMIGLTGQSAAIDDLLTGRENLIMMGRLYHLTNKSAIKRADELLEEFGLVDAGNRITKTYSGGMKRRLDLAISLIATPPVIFLDEPTTGLDPRSRLAMWAIIRTLLQNGTTILLTTQYLEEADQLADRIAVIDEGKVIAEGTAMELKAKVGKDRLELTFTDEEKMVTAKEALHKYSVSVDGKNFSVSVVIENTKNDVQKILETISNASIDIISLTVRKPTLDDVFLTLTGKNVGKANAAEDK